MMLPRFARRMTALALIAFWCGTALPCFAGDFDSTWQPRPLVDNSLKPQSSIGQTAVAPAPAQPDLENMLKPAEPFIQSVENQLFVKPHPGIPLVQRLNNLQTILFGEQKYKDAGQLLAKLAELYPQEAAKAHADLMAQTSNTMPPQSAAAGKKNGVIERSGTQKQAVTNAAHPTVSTIPGPAMADPRMNATQTSKKRFWQSDDDWDGFEKDSFFNDKPSDPPVSGGSKLRSLGAGVAGLAMLAGTVAGSYYLNQKLGGNKVNANQPYGYDPYYGYYPYGSGVYGGYTGYPGYYTQPGILPNGVYPSPYGYSYTQTGLPYRSYPYTGTSSRLGTGLLGPLTGFSY